MKITTINYRCDGCKKKLPEPHLSITLGNGWSGWVKQIVYNTEMGDIRWEHFGSPNKFGQIIHVCNGQCLEKYFK